MLRDPHSFDPDPDPAFRLNNDPEPEPIRSRIQGFDGQKVKKFTAGKKNFGDQKLQFTYP